MASKKIFSSTKSVNGTAPQTDTVNDAGGKAYKFSTKHALAQYSVTNTFADGFYKTGEDQFEAFVRLLKQTDTVFAAKVAIYAHQKGLMKDSPAAILADIASRDGELLKKVFSKVVTNAKMLRNFVQMIRSGKFSRKSFGNVSKKLIQKWFDSRSDEQLFNDAIGNDPSLADIIKMVHPKPKNKAREALYAYILGKEVSEDKLPSIVREFEAFKRGELKVAPEVSFQRLTSLDLTDDHWKQIAENASWTQVRMNLNTFARHNVFSDKKLVKKIASKLSSRDEIKRAKVFPYQLFMAFLNVEEGVPVEIKNALQEAMEVAIENVPSFGEKNVKVAVDVSGSMSSNSLTGNRGSATSKARCIDVAALIGSVVLRKNKESALYPFDTRVHSTKDINGFDSVMSNAGKLRCYGGGGTDCGVAMKAILDQAQNGDVADVVLFISDNESWFRNEERSYRGTDVAEYWNKLQKINPKAKMVCIDLVANETTQIVDSGKVLNIGGFGGDAVFEEIERFVNGSNVNSWVEEIEKIEI